MEPDKNVIDIDPDYETNNTAIRKIEEQAKEENKVTAEKLSKIISEELDKELSNRQKQLEEIEDKIFRAQKLLHLVRYVLVTSYYNKKSLEYKEEEDNNRPFGFDSQNRIHPAVKKLLGNSSLELINSRGKRRARQKNDDNQALGSHVPVAKKIKLEPKVFPETITKPHKVDNNQNSLMNRKKTRHRIVIGNISKWMPSLENDNTTHKWMVYVRGLKEAPDVSHIIDKVVFYLHPSYRPHDVVEVSESPFHLSRRGWGEFPLRVQIFFRCLMNKPVSIVHNLKLDKTYTGRQTLGNETIVDLYLYDDNTPTKTGTTPTVRQETFEEKFEFTSNTNTRSETPDNQSPNKIVVKKENLEYSATLGSPNNITPLDSASTSFERDYSHEENIAEHVIGERVFDDSMELEEQVVPITDFSLNDHSYSLPFDEITSSQAKEDKKVDATYAHDENNKLIFGLDESYSEPEAELRVTVKNKDKVDSPKDKYIFKTLTTSTGQPIKFLPQSFNKVLLSNGNVIQIKVLQQSVLKKIDPSAVSPIKPMTQERKIDYKKLKVQLPKDKFKNMGEVLPYLFKRVPLWSKLAADSDFNCTYPFIAGSMEEFTSWDIGRRLSSEWSRAKTVKSILQNEPLPDLKYWNTKAFFMYARSHGFCPPVGFGTIYKAPSREKEMLMSCFSKSLPRKGTLPKASVDVDVDIESDSESTCQTRPKVTDISDPSLQHHCTFVKEAALDCNIVFKPEELEEGIVMNAAERMVLEAVKCFAEELIRRGRHHLVCQEDFCDKTDEIGVNEVKLALSERSEMESITNFQRKKREMDFFFL